MNRQASVTLVADIDQYTQNVSRAAGLLSNYGNTAARIGQQVATQFSRISTSSAQMGNAVSASLSRATAAMRQNYDAQIRLNAAANRSTGNNSSITGSLGKLALGYFSVSKAYELFKEGLKITSDYERIDASLKAVSRSADDYARTQLFLRTTSDTLGLSYESLAAAYKGLKAASNGTNLEGAQTERIFLAVARAGATLKLSDDEVKGSLLALQQMMSKGTVQAEELRGQLGERLPGAFGLAARAMNVTEAQLGKMLESGQVMAADLLPRLADELEKTYGAGAQANINSMAGGWTRATDQLKFFVSEFAKTNNIDTFFAKLGNGVADYIKLIRQAQEQTGSMFGTIKNYTPGFQKDLNTFKSLRSEQKESFLSKFEKNIGEKESQLGVVASSAPTDENLALEKRINLQIKDMKIRYGIYRRALREENLKNAKEAEAANNLTASKGPAFDIDKAKDRQSALAKQIANATINGGPVASLQAEYNKLTAQIDRATDSTKKHTAASVSNVVGLTTNAAILSRLTRELQQQGEDAPASLRERVALFKELAEQEKELSKFKPVDLGDKIKISDKHPLERIGEAIRGQIAPLQQYQGLLARFGDVSGYGGISQMQEDIEKINYQIASFSLKNMEVPQEALDKLAEYTQKLNKAQAAVDEGKLNKSNKIAGVSVGGFNLQVFNDSANTLQERIKTLGQSISSSLQNAAASAATGMGELIGGLIAGTASLSQIPGMIGSIFANLAKTMGESMIAFGTAGLAAKAFLSNPVTAIIGGVALIALGSALQGLMAQQSSAAFAKPMETGGLFTGESVIRVAESHKARKGGGEWVTPVDRGAELMVDQMERRGMTSALNQSGSSTQNLTPNSTRVLVDVGGKLRLEGSDLVLSYDRTKRGQKTFGNGR